MLIGAGIQGHIEHIRQVVLSHMGLFHGIAGKPHYLFVHTGTGLICHKAAVTAELMLERFLLATLGEIGKLVDRVVQGSPFYRPYAIHQRRVTVIVIGPLGIFPIIRGCRPSARIIFYPESSVGSMTCRENGRLLIGSHTDHHPPTIGGYLQFVPNGTDSQRSR